MSFASLTVEVPGKPEYEVHVGPQLLERLGGQLKCRVSGRRVLVVTDGTVASLYLDKVCASLKDADFETHTLSFEGGEESKTLGTVDFIWKRLAELAFGRDSLVLALGGGVVGDMAGFAAACYMRGIDYVQVPTTLLAMVDSSVGGKTGVNLSWGKNLVGAFKQPKYVCASIDVLSTLPDREWSCGCAEIAKAAVIAQGGLFTWLVEHAKGLYEREDFVVVEAVKRSVAFKAEVVAEDEHETRGVRECLNYGHTLGHAYETLAGYGVLSHGLAVSEGMRFAARLSETILGASPTFVREQEALLDALGLPRLAEGFAAEELLGLMTRDKKVRQGKLRFVLAREPGKWEVKALDSAFVLEQLQAWEASR